MTILERALRLADTETQRSGNLCGFVMLLVVASIPISIFFLSVNPVYVFVLL